MNRISKALLFRVAKVIRVNKFMGHACLQKSIPNNVGRKHQTKAYKTIDTQLLSVNDFVFYVFYEINDHLSATAAAPTKLLNRQTNAHKKRKQKRCSLNRFSSCFCFVLFSDFKCIEWKTMHRRDEFGKTRNKIECFWRFVNA